ncbi:hypothetical protein BKA70DRAFT_199204 [Coprinopsis sp. MPI-PUGE-AT-0042]|nr:hypothetical protein BKA70DRAFT_199204 [Coprinopsis sp. MPI-PUGE-AT-0042]
MAYSPPIRRLSTASNSNRQQEELINAYEAEEERIINLLSRKLEQLRQEKIGLENALEAESESHVNRLSRELTALRLAQHQLQQQQQQQANGAGPSQPSSALSNADLASVSPEARVGFKTFMNGCNPADPSVDVMLETLRRENEQLRNKLVDTERDFVRISRLNDIYREELIEHRRRLGISTDTLIGVSPDALSQPTHHRSAASSPSTTSFPAPARPSHSQGVPIPRPANHHRPSTHISSSELNTPLSHSPTSPESSFPFSPGISVATTGVSVVSANTNVTSPPSSASLHNLQPLSLTLGRGLSYPLAPPPSLSSSFGSPTVSFHMPHRDVSLSPIEPLSRRNSNARRGSVSRGGGGGSTSASRRASMEFGARVAETGTLVPRATRSRAGSQSLDQQLQATVEDGVFDKFDTDLTVVAETEDGPTDTDGKSVILVGPSSVSQ